MSNRRNRRNQVPDVHLKLQLIIIGDSGVGKTSFMDSFVEGNEKTFCSSVHPTVGIDFKVKHIVVNEKRIKLHIWDTAGQEKFNSITTAYYRSAKGAIIMYDVTRPITFRNIEKWYNLLQEHVRGDVEVAIVGNKCDLRSDKKVDTKSGENLATELGCHYYESSAKDNLNIENVFMGVVHKDRRIEIIKILADMPLETPIPSGGAGGVSVNPSDESPQQQSSCSC